MSIQLTSQKGKRYLYCDKDLVAKGGFGEVYKGIDVQTDEVVAVKRVDNSKIERLGDEYVKCLGNEANLLLEMNYNDRCVRIIDCFKTTGSVYIIMEFCDGGTLDGIMKKRPHSRLPEKEALEIFAEVVEGLSAMHNRGTMHRDMKPDNVFIKNGRYKIGDFGFATSKECSNQICGTPQYMAPEIHNAFKEGAK
jgi:serine/threonine protein kinase